MKNEFTLKFATLYMVITSTYLIYEFTHEFDILLNHSDPLHTAVELLIIIFSLFGLLLVIKHYFAAQRDNAYFRHELHKSNQELLKISERMKAGKSEFLRLINWQFEQWSFSEGERQIGMLLLKGLSFDEISSIRNTSSKTVQKQATSIYAKSGLKNRNEFSAWFLEEFL